LTGIGGATGGIGNPARGRRTGLVLTDSQSAITNAAHGEPRTHESSQSNVSASLTRRFMIGWEPRHADRRRHRALRQCGAIASHASNILPGSGAFHRDETARQALYAQTRLCLSFGNGAGSGPPAMGAAKHDGPSVQRGHRLSVIAVHDGFVRCLRAGILCQRRPPSLFKIAHFRCGRPATWRDCGCAALPDVACGRPCPPRLCW
jgi:hypothetical protein